MATDPYKPIENQTLSIGFTGTGFDHSLNMPQNREPRNFYIISLNFPLLTVYFWKIAPSQELLQYSKKVC